MKAPGGRMVWVPIDQAPRGVASECMAPRHGSTSVPAAWYVCLVADDDEPLFQPTCQECMAFMAADLGTTPEAGALRR